MAVERVSEWNIGAYPSPRFSSTLATLAVWWIWLVTSSVSVRIISLLPFSSRVTADSSNALPKTVRSLRNSNRRET